MMATKPELIAHRGYAARFPENSYIGIEAAIEAGAGFVEMDVQLAADKTPVLFHDRTLERICGVAGSIARFTRPQLAAFSASEPSRLGDAFAGTRITALANMIRLMRRHPDVHFFIELKCVSIECFGAATVLEQVHKALRGLERRCTLISFSIETLSLAKERGLRTGLILENWQQGQGLSNPVFQPDYVFCNIKRLPASGRLHIPGVILAAYEIDDAKLALALAVRGVAMIETYTIAEMRRALAGL